MNSPFRVRYLGGCFVQRLVQAVWWFLLSVPWVPQFASAQEPQTHMRFDHVGIEHGLSQSRVNAIIQDTQGFMWFATEEGLNRFDGYTCKVFLHNPQDTTTLPHNFVRALHVDRSGTLWVGSHGGLSKYDPRTNRFTTYSPNASNPQSLSHNFVTVIFEDARGDFWIGTRGGGVNRFNPRTGVFQRFMFDVNNPSSLSNNDVWTITEDQSGNIWIGTQRGVNRLSKENKATGAMTRFLPEPHQPQSLAAANVWRIRCDRSGTVWAGTWGGGLHKFEPATQSWQRFVAHPEHPNSLSQNIILTMLEDRSGSFWCGTRGGLLRFDKATGKFTQFQHYPNDQSSVAHNHVWSLYEDREGNLWVGTDDGVSRYSPFTTRFQHYENHPDKPRSLSHDNVQIVHEDRSGNLWVGTWGGGLNLFDRKTGECTIFTNDPKNPNSLTHNSIWAFCEDTTGVLWVGTRQGVNRFDHKRNRWTLYQHNDNDSTSISHDFARTMLTDREGIVWIGTMLGGVNRMNPYTNYPTFTSFRHNPNNPQSLSGNEVVALCEDSSNAFLWAGTNGNGLNRLEKQTGRCIRYRRNPQNPRSLTSDTLTMLYRSKSGALWVGTMNGLNRYDPATDDFTHFTTADGLPNNVIAGILEDKNGNLWLSTERGLAKFNPTTKTVERYQPSDGIQGLRFMPRSCCKLRSGEFMFGGMSGFNLFHPDSIRRNQHVPPVVLTSFKKFNEEAALKGNIAMLDVLELTHRDYVISFEFAALDFAAPANNHYAYKLEGFDADWIYSGAQHFASYTNLNDGEYTFRVKASNNDDLWNEQGAALRVIVRPPWWRTWWAYITYLSVLVAVVFVVVRFRERKQRQRLRTEQREREAEIVRRKNTELAAANEQLRHVNNEKDEFLGIAAHDLKNPIAGIALQMHLLRQNSTLTDKERAAIHRVQESAETMISLISRLLDLNAIESGKRQIEPAPFDLVALTHSVIEHYCDAAQAKQIALHTEFPAIPRLAYSDRDATRQIIDNLLSNALKFSPPSSSVYLRICSEASANTVRLAISDEGQGITANEQALLFERFQQLTARPTAKEHSSGLGLSIVKRLAEAMNGRVWYEPSPQNSSENGSQNASRSGATFVLELPAA